MSSTEDTKEAPKKAKPTAKFNNLSTALKRIYKEERKLKQKILQAKLYLNYKQW
ncbi:MAG: hypothetical protein RCG16_08290 [Rickettsia hoogstraalii]